MAENELPTGWRTTTLGEIVCIIGGGTPKTTVDEFWNGNIPWLSVVDFNNDNRWVSKTEKTITEDGLNNCSTKLLDIDDLIISARGTVGALAQLKRPMAFNQSCYGLREIEDVSDEDFLFYLVRYSLQDINRNVHGAVFDTITRQTFDYISVNLPPLKEQKAIAKVLSSFDDKIELLQEQNKTLEETAQTIFKEWFGKYQVGDKLPEGWTVEEIGNLVELIIDYRGRTPKKLGMDWSLDGIPALSAKTIKKGKIVRRDAMNHGSEELYLKWMKDELKRGDILLTSEAPLGEMYYLTDDTKYILSQRLFALRVNKEISSQYLYHFLFSKNGQHALSSRASGSTVEGIKQSELRKVEIIIPERKLLIKASDIFEGFFQKASNNNKEIESLKKTRDQLLPKLMNGLIRVQN